MLRKLSWCTLKTWLPSQAVFQRECGIPTESSSKQGRQAEPFLICVWKISSLLPPLSSSWSCGALAFCLITSLAPEKADASRGWYNGDTYYSLYSPDLTGKLSSHYARGWKLAQSLQRWLCPLGSHPFTLSEPCSGARHYGELVKSLTHTSLLWMYAQVP